MKFAICNEMFEDWDFAAVCRCAADIGYEGLEIAPFTLADDVRTLSSARRWELRQIAADQGLEVVGLHWLLVKPEGLGINHPDENVRRRTQEYLKALAEFCRDLGGQVMVFGSPKQRNVWEGESYQATWQRTVEALRACLPTFEACGVTLCWEPLPAGETNFINTKDEAVRLIEEINHPRVRLHLDVKAMFAAETKPLPQVIEEAAPYLGHVHANDPNRLGPGMGAADLRPLAAALRKIGYQGYVSVEVFDFTPGPERIAQESFAYLQEVFAR